MAEKRHATIQWSVKDLKGLVSDKNCRVYAKTTCKHLALHPYHLNDLNKSLRDILSTGINYYDPDLKGLVLAYKNPKLLSELGGIFHDSHYIHVDIEADFYIFKPKVGCKLKGVINKKLNGHLGVLVHKTFNVSIFRKTEGEQEDNWQGLKLSVGDEITFVVTYIDFNGRLPFIRGTLVPNDESEQETEKIEDNSEAEIDEENKFNNNDSEEEEEKIKENIDDNLNIADESLISSSRQIIDELDSGKSKKRKRMASDDEESVTVSPKKSKKKLKKIKISSDIDDGPVESNEKEIINEKDLETPKIKTKKSMKKLENLEEIVADENETVEKSPKKKKIKKHRSDKSLTELNESIEENGKEELLIPPHRVKDEHEVEMRKQKLKEDKLKEAKLKESVEESSENSVEKKDKSPSKSKATIEKPSTETLVNKIGENNVKIEKDDKELKKKKKKSNKIAIVGEESFQPSDYESSTESPPAVPSLLPPPKSTKMPIKKESQQQKIKIKEEPLSDVEGSNKKSKQEKNKKNNIEIDGVKIKEEPVSDVEGSNKKSKHDKNKKIIEESSEKIKKIKKIKSEGVKKENSSQEDDARPKKKFKTTFTE